jgi:hypothetical protein
MSGRHVMRQWRLFASMLSAALFGPVQTRLERAIGDRDMIVRHGG